MSSELETKQSQFGRALLAKAQEEETQIRMNAATGAVQHIMHEIETHEEGIVFRNRALALAKEKLAAVEAGAFKISTRRSSLGSLKGLIFNDARLNQVLQESQLEEY